MQIPNNLKSSPSKNPYIWDFTSRVILALRSYPCEMVYVSWMNGGWLRVHRELWVGGGWRTQPCQFFHGKNLPPPASGQSFAEGHPVKRYFVLNRTPGNNFSENIWIFNHGTVCIKEVGSCSLQCVFGHAWPLYLSPSMRKTLWKKRQVGCVMGFRVSRLIIFRQKVPENFRGQFCNYGNDIMQQKMLWGSLSCDAPGVAHSIISVSQQAETVGTKGYSVIARPISIPLSHCRYVSGDESISAGYNPPDLVKYGPTSFETHMNVFPPNVGPPNGMAKFGVFFHPTFDNCSVVLLGVEPLQICAFVTDSCPVRLRVPKFPSTQKSR